MNTWTMLRTLQLLSHTPINHPLEMSWRWCGWVDGESSRYCREPAHKSIHSRQQHRLEIYSGYNRILLGVCNNIHEPAHSISKGVIKHTCSVQSKYILLWPFWTCDNDDGLAFPSSLWLPLLCIFEKENKSISGKQAIRNKSLIFIYEDLRPTEWIFK